MILDRDPDATERLITKAQEIMAAKEAEKAAAAGGAAPVKLSPPRFLSMPKIV